MDAQYEIRADPARGMIRVHMGGFFDQSDVQSFAADYRAELRLVAHPGQLTLVDIRDMKIQAQDVVAAFGSVMAAPDIRSRKLAFLCGSTLARLQAQRLTDREGVAFFDDAAAAEAWLLA